MDTLNQYGNNSETHNQTSAQNQMKADNQQKMDDQRAENEEKDKKEEGLLLAIDGAKIKFNAHMGTFKVLSNVPTTQDKLTGTIVEKQIPNFIFDDGFQMITLTEWQDFGTAKVQENYVLLKKSTLPGTGKMPGSVPPETGKIEFVTSGQVNAPESIDAKGAPVPEQKEDKKYYCNRDFTPDEIREIVIALRKGEITGYTTQKTIEIVNGVKKKVSKKVALTVYDMRHTKDLLFANQSDIKRTEHLSVEDSSYDKVTDSINKVLKNYDINTCIRKIHFIAQAHHESHRFRATFEGRTEKNTPSNYSGGYNFQGRGFMQITHDYNYVKYYNKVFKTKEDLKDKNFYKDKLIPFAQLLATNVEYAFDSAGWYWKNDDKVNAIGVNMNVAADQDNTLYVSQGINGKVKHPNGLEERIKYVADLKKIMKYENCINNKK
ncbi:hypothetical protein C1631_012995 [Chryseobacterium phosphatilyticum]|uniref:Glycoside hydrolase family 19 catalytic domain-containing protein n=1 Tax=Chryseobacterium phosphatilyticum TaxID=475075 RepID=A0A316X5E9_9FLAO|nr:hypothetical protein [Chryseobacterium phosphatilyticum]PWN68982.1 hypothetical protein C1631_012995 [Chryseobacterium phosphatilyticum]